MDHRIHTPKSDVALRFVDEGSRPARPIYCGFSRLRMRRSTHTSPRVSGRQSGGTEVLKTRRLETDETGKLDEWINGYRNVKTKGVHRLGFP